MPKLNRSNQSTGHKEYKATAIPRNPIITVTEHTPTPSPDFMRRQVGCSHSFFMDYFKISIEISRVPLTHNLML